MSIEEIKAELRLFKAYTSPSNYRLFTNYIEGVLKGLLFKSEEVPTTVLREAIRMYGINPEQYNQTLHKSFGKVAQSSMEQLLAEQIIHYITTYGFQSLGIYDDSTVYIPAEKLDIPELEDNVYLTVIDEITEEELSDRLMTLATSGLALSKETIEDILTLSAYIKADKINEITVRELRVALYDKYDIVPKDPTEFFRYMIYKLTGDTLFINNSDTINKLKSANIVTVCRYIDLYLKTAKQSGENGINKLAEIFSRYRDLFLALRAKPALTPKQKELNHIINRIAIMSKKIHKPIKQNILDNITQIYTLKTFEDYKEEIDRALEKCTTFRMVRILNALKFRQFKESEYMIYKIRNGKAFVQKNKDTAIPANTFKTMYMYIANKLMKRVRNNIQGKTFYIPDNIHYTLPQSEKQFVGNIPEGSCVELPLDKSMVVGIHWFNLDNNTTYNTLYNKVDLDLKLRNKSESYGWNTAYRDEDNNFLFSGDMTSAPKPDGATEVFYIGTNCPDKAFTLTVNKYTSNNSEVPFKFFIAEQDNIDEILNKNYVVDPNKIIVQLDRKFEYDSKAKSVTNDMTLGLIKIQDGVLRFYFNDFTTGSNIVSNQTFVTTGIHEYNNEYVNTQIKLEDFIKSCGGIIVKQPTIEETKYYELYENFHSREEITKYRADELIAMGNDNCVQICKEQKPVDYNLSLDSISKDSIIKLLTNVK